jgi:hypothetical protein
MLATAWGFLFGVCHMSSFVHCFMYGQTVDVTLAGHCYRAIVISRWRIGQTIIRVRILNGSYAIFADVRCVTAA